MAIILLINFFGQRFLTWVSNLATIGKLLALGLIIVAGIIVFLKPASVIFTIWTRLKPPMDSL